MKDGERLYGLPGPLEKLSRLITSSVGRGYRVEEKLAQFEQRTGSKLAQLEQQAQSTLAQLESNLVQLEQRTGSKLAQIEQQAQSTLAQLEQRTESKFAELKHQTNEVQALGQRLDSDVVKGFAALVSRLDDDIILLKENA